MKGLFKAIGHFTLANTCLFVAFNIQAQSLPDCFATPKIFSGTTLAKLADLYFADVDYRYAILLATNSRSSIGFPYIGNPNKLPLGRKVCIPEITEAERLKKRFLTYIDAVHDMALPEPSERSFSLDAIDINQPIITSSWIRETDAAKYRPLIGQTISMDKDSTWVTISTQIKQFCNHYVKTNGNDPRGLSLRLEQRLGLAPHSGKTSFVELEIANPGSTQQIFRPCASSDVATKTCALGPPKTCEVPVAGSATDQSQYQACHQHNDFFVNQYYNSYGVALPTEFPWTSLGYTFDWGHGPLGLNNQVSFVRYGESEYVIPKNAQVIVKGVYDTAEYCGATNN